MWANNYALMKSSHLESLAEVADRLIARPLEVQVQEQPLHLHTSHFSQV